MIVITIVIFTIRLEDQPEGCLLTKNERHA